jgi:hypothetical protein
MALQGPTPSVVFLTLADKSELPSVLTEGVRNLTSRISILSNCLKFSSPRLTCPPHHGDWDQMDLESFMSTCTGAHNIACLCSVDHQRVVLYSFAGWCGVHSAVCPVAAYMNPDWRGEYFTGAHFLKVSLFFCCTHPNSLCNHTAVSLPKTRLVDVCPLGIPC